MIDVKHKQNIGVFQLAKEVMFAGGESQHDLSYSSYVLFKVAPLY